VLHVYSRPKADLVLNVNLGINSSTKLMFYPIFGSNELLKF